MGGFNYWFKPKNVVSNQNLLDKDQDILWKNFYLIYTDQSRNSGSVLLEQKTNIQKNEKRINQIVDLAFQAKKSVLSKNYDNLGPLLDEGWSIKKMLSSNVTSKYIDDVLVSINNGATGGKLYGAGNRGFLLFYVPRKNHIKFEDAFSKKKIVKFSCSKLGAATILNDEE